jgi:hypothetical protein
LPPVEPPELDEEDELDEELELLELDEEDELPPVDVEVEPPDVEVDPPEVDVEPPDVEVDPPEVEVELPPDEVETVIVVVPPEEVLPPKNPPEKKPPKPPPKPPEPPITIGTPPPLLVTMGGGGGGGGAKTGGMMVRVVTVSVAGAVQATRRTVRRTWRCFGAAVLARAGLALAWLTIAGRAGGFSATWTAPPPTTAPPTVQAHSFARAIRTDIISIPFLAGGRWDAYSLLLRSHAGVAMDEQMQRLVAGASALAVCGAVRPPRSRFRPIHAQLPPPNERAAGWGWAEFGRRFESCRPDSWSRNFAGHPRKCVSKSDSRPV